MGSTSDAWTLFQLLDADGTYTIDIEEFVMGCTRLRGSAKSIDIAKVIADGRWLKKRVAGMVECLAQMQKQQAVLLRREAMARTSQVHLPEWSVRANQVHRGEM